MSNQPLPRCKYGVKKGHYPKPRQKVTYAPVSAYRVATGSSFDSKCGGALYHKWCDNLAQLEPRNGDAWRNYQPDRRAKFDPVKHAKGWHKLNK